MVTKDMFSAQAIESHHPEGKVRRKGYVKQMRFKSAVKG